MLITFEEATRAAQKAWGEKGIATKRGREYQVGSLSRHFSIFTVFGRGNTWRSALVDAELIGAKPKIKKPKIQKVIAMPGVNCNENPIKEETDGTSRQEE
jgi:hypothetical protein